MVVFRELSRFLTRSMPLIAVECWYEGGAGFFESFFGVSFPPRVYLHREGVFEFYTNLEEFYDLLPRKLVGLLENKRVRIGLVREYMVEGLVLFGEVRLKRKRTVDSLLLDLTRVKEFFTRGFLGVYISHHVPISHEKFRQEGEVLFDEKLIKGLIKWREAEGNVFFNRGVEAINFLLGEIAERKRLDAGLLKYVTFKELSDFVAKGRPLDVRAVRRRMKSDFAYFDYEILYGSEINGKLKNLGYVIKKDEILEYVHDVKGRSACPGRVVGAVRIVKSPADVGKVGFGDVIVSPMTTADMILAVKKAAAIVTDEGGITSHAAVISREFGIPCVVGTHNATRIFNDGDLIEVDANNGIVRLFTISDPRSSSSGRSEASPP